MCVCHQTVRLPHCWMWARGIVSTVCSDRCASVFCVPYVWSICAQRWAEEKYIRVCYHKKKRHAACKDDSFRRAASKVVRGQLLARLTNPLVAHDPSARAQGQWQSVVEQLDRGPINLLHLHVCSAQANHEHNPQEASSEASDGKYKST